MLYERGRVRVSWRARLAGKATRPSHPDDFDIRSLGPSFRSCAGHDTGNGAASKITRPVRRKVLLVPLPLLQQLLMTACWASLTVSGEPMLFLRRGIAEDLFLPHGPYKPGRVKGRRQDRALSLMWCEWRCDQGPKRQTLGDGGAWDTDRRGLSLKALHTSQYQHLRRDCSVHISVGPVVTVVRPSCPRSRRSTVHPNGD